MNTSSQLWGTVSVRDHLRPNAFVSELVLFDTLVVPRPPKGEDWPAPWQPKKQDEILSWIPNAHVMEVPWAENEHHKWHKRDIAKEAQDDVLDVQRHPDFQKTKQSQNFDTPLTHLTRRVLQDYVDEERSKRQLKGIPAVPVDIIPAYDGPKGFMDDAPDQEQILRAFGWEFLVPHDETSDGKRRSHEDQIKAALELCAIPDVQDHRNAFRAWTSVEALKGTTVEDARDRMETLVADYAKAVAATKIPVKLKWGAGLAEVLGAVAALAINPAFALVGPAIKLGEASADKTMAELSKIPDRVKPAGLIHGMRKSFSDAGIPAFDFADTPKIRVEHHWPNGSPTLYL